jgi:hypothetical protein
MLHQHIHHGYIEAIIDRRTPRPARLLQLAELKARRRGRRAA